MKTVLSFALVINAQMAFAYDTSKFNVWLAQETVVSKAKIFEAMSQPDLALGSIIASPSKQDPDYYYHWVRDAALVSDVLVELYKKATSATDKAELEQKIKNYISFSKQNQNADTLTGLGEPKFYVSGQPYNLSWGRPQNDGPALRALTIIKWAQLKIQAGDEKYVRDELYQSVLPALSVIKKDLEFVSYHWKDPSFDLWEEVQGDHFFTRAVQRSALIEGAKLAQAMGDSGASDWYSRQAQQIEYSMLAFKNSTLNYIPTTLNYFHGLSSKNSNLDIAVILGLLRSQAHDSFFPINDKKVIQTIEALKKEFTMIYPINQRKDMPGIAIGRYPEDVYGGADFSAGNPWVLTTLAVAEAYYEMALLEKDALKSKGLIAEGEKYFQRVHVHANPDGSLSEQISRHNGYMISAHNLTWNYAAVLTANWARERALSK